MADYLTGSSITATIGGIAIPSNTICYFVSNSYYAYFSNNSNEIFVNATSDKQPVQITTSNITDTSKSSVTVSISGYCEYGGKQSNTASTSFTLKQAVNNIGISSASKSATYGATNYNISYTIVPSNAFNKGVTFTQSSGNSVSINGKNVTVLAAGSSTITYTSADGKVSGQFTINVNPRNLSNVTVNWGTTTFAYDGNAKMVTPTLKYGSMTLTNGTDYEIAGRYRTDAGTTTVTVTGKGNYTGTLTTTLTVNKADQDAPIATGATTYYPEKAVPKASGGGGHGEIQWSSYSALSTVGSVTTQARWSGDTNYNASPWSDPVTLTVSYYGY